jgi:HEPN domain-containing protein
MDRHADWLDQAVRDLDRARIDVDYAFWEWACFTAQQAAEKAVKAVHIAQGLDVWGHAITPMLRRLAGSSDVPPEIIGMAQMLDAYYIPARYPNGFPEGKPADYFNESMAREAVDAASAILRFCQDRIAGQDSASR